MKRFALLSATCALALSSCGLFNAPVAPMAPQGITAYGVDAQGKLVMFGTENAAGSLTRMTVTGLGSGETLVDLDVRNTDNRLYGVTGAGVVYWIDPATGAATRDGASVGKSVQAVDFNPVANRLRVIGTGNDNYRLTLNSAPVPATSPAGTVTADGTFAYVTGDANAGKTPNLVAAAYTNSFNNSGTGAVATGTTTTLFSVDADQDTLVEHTVGPQFSTLGTRGKLGVDAMKGMTGLDIAGANGAYLTVSSGASTMLYTVNLTTGAATMKSTVGGLTLKAFALALSAQ